MTKMRIVFSAVLAALCGGQATAQAVPIVESNVYVVVPPPRPQKGIDFYNLGSAPTPATAAPFFDYGAANAPAPRFEDTMERMARARLLNAQAEAQQMRNDQQKRVQALSTHGATATTSKATAVSGTLEFGCGGTNGTGCYLVNAGKKSYIIYMMRDAPAPLGQMLGESHNRRVTVRGHLSSLKVGIFHVFDSSRPIDVSFSR